jgi:cholesterol oxidase
MTRLSATIDRIGDRYDVVVVGSGYGGGVAACRLAAAGKRVCVLEHGREIRPGEYPNDTRSLAAELQLDLATGRLGPATALFDFRVYDDLNVAMGCGLGGTSLINAGLCLRPDARLFDDRRWPAELREPAALDPCLTRAEAMLRPAVYPPGRGRLAKLEALERIARGLQRPVGRAPMLVNFDPLPGGVNPSGEAQGACVGCGDCISGCNYAAKNTVLATYLPQAKKQGAEIFTGARVTHLDPAGGGWRVCFQVAEPGGKRFSGSLRSVAAGAVVLGAGALGSTEVLLRSRAAGLALSPALGHRVSGNGDMVGLIYNADWAVNGVGLGKRSAAGREPVGACSTGLVDGRVGAPLEDGYVMVDGAIPGALAKWLPAAYRALDVLTGSDADSGWRDRLRARGRALQSKLFGPYTGAVHRTQACLMVTHDDAAGELRLEGDRLVLSWPGVGRQAPFARADAAMRAAARALGGSYIPNPVWHDLLGRKLITGHPLGGCAMADDARDGVVDHRGRVYAGASGTGVHDGLYVMDAAVVPRSLGVNPLLLITALAERSVDLLLQA